MENNACFNMVESQLRAWRVFDSTILELFTRLPRVDFIPEEFRALAYADIPTPIGYRQTTWCPSEEGRILQAMAIRPDEHVLEIGTGCGFFTALLAQLAHTVDSIEIIPELHHHSAGVLATHHIQNVTLTLGDALHQWKPVTLYDKIIVTGSLSHLPNLLLPLLKPEGELFAIVGQMPIMEAIIFKSMGSRLTTKTMLFETVTNRLVHGENPPSFVF